VLRGQVAALERDAVYEKKDLAKVQKEAAVARSKQAKAEKELIELRERIRPRTMNEYQRGAMVAALVGEPDKGHVSIHCVAGDAEGLAFATQIKAVFEAAQWESIDGVDQASFSTNPVGIFIIVREEKATPL